MDDPLNIFITRLEGTGPRSVGVKDLFDTAGVRTTCGSHIYRDRVPETTAEAVRRLEVAGWALAGKTNTHEFAYGATSENPWYGPVRNPHDPERVAGGSSGGSAAGVALGLFGLGLGTDTGGSIRVPASACGVVGFKPSFDAVPLDGCMPLVPWLDHAGPIAADVGGCIEAFSVLADREQAPAVPADVLRAGVMGALDAVQDDIAAVFAAAVARVREAGVAIETLDLPPLPEAGAPLRYVAAAHVHRATFPARRWEYGRDLQELLDLGHHGPSHLEALALWDEIDAWRERCAEAMGGVDLLLTPTLPITPPVIGGDQLTARRQLLAHTAAFNYLGWPALSIPCGRDAAGMPVGLQLVARDDGLALGAALALEPAIRG